MKLEHIETIVAIRKLVLHNGGAVLVIIGQPQPFPDSQDYYCPYQITGLGRGNVKYAGGVDAIQALQLAMKMVGADLYTSDEARNGLLRWEGGEKGNLGFPVPDTLSDLARGSK